LLGNGSLRSKLCCDLAGSICGKRDQVSWLPKDRKDAKERDAGFQRGDACLDAGF